MHCSGKVRSRFALHPTERLLATRPSRPIGKPAWHRRLCANARIPSVRHSDVTLLRPTPNLPKLVSARSADRAKLGFAPRRGGGSWLPTYRTNQKQAKLDVFGIDLDPAQTGATDNLLQGAT